MNFFRLFCGSSSCKYQVGSCEDPPLNYHLLPLKLVKCYQKALKIYGKSQNKSDISLVTAFDVPNRDDDVIVNKSQQHVIYELMGLTRHKS